MARLVGINHVALEVGDLGEALAWYGRFFELGAVDRHAGMAFVDLGDQFLAFTVRTERSPDAERHFGLVVDDKAAVRRALEAAGVPLTPTPNCTFRDPWGNAVQVVDYRQIQFTKVGAVLDAMRLPQLEKTEEALDELRAKGVAV